MRKSSLLRIAILGILALVSIALFLGYHLPNRWQYVLNNRALTISAIVITGIAIALATMLFQTVVNNRILTPSILGLDSLYLLIQTGILFLFGSKTLLSINPFVLFLMSTGVMIGFMLVGIDFGTFFGSLTTFMEVLIDPNEFQISQDFGFASFNRINTKILWLALAMLVAVILYSLRYWKYLDVLALGREQALSLGVDYQHMVKKLLIIVAILTSVSTALVGPLVFLGLLVMNITFEFMQDYRHKLLIPAAMLLAVFTLVCGQFLLIQVFTFSTPLSVIINFVGGLYFLSLLLRANKKWQ